MTSTPAALAAGLVLAMSTAPAAVSGSALSGAWSVQGSRTVFRFLPCGEAACATLESSGRIIRDADVRDLNNHDPQLRTRRLKGLAVLQDLRPVGAERWRGRIYSPGAGATYVVDVRRVDADTLTAKACAAPLLCRTDTLKRMR